MNIVKASTHHKCKRGHDIWTGDRYYKQKRGKALCLECGKPRISSFIVKILSKIK